MHIQAFIPVYQHPKRLVESVRVLSAEDHPGSEIVVVVDGLTTPDIAQALDVIRETPRVRILEGRPHLGKAAALNGAVLESDCEAVLFLDNDIILPQGMHAFQLCESLMADCDIAELPKLGQGDGILASMVRLEFLVNVVATDYLIGRKGRCPTMNGAAFLIRGSLFRQIGGFRPVVNEDMDIAARAFFSGARSGFDPALTVRNDVPESFGFWFRQRRRWTINAPLWAQVYMPRIQRENPEMLPFILKSGLVFPLPFIVACLCIILNLLPSPVVAMNLPWRVFTALLSLVIFMRTETWFASGARKYGTYFKLPAYILFSLFYLPVWGVAYAMGWLSVFSGKLPELGWKYDGKAEEEPAKSRYTG